MPKQKELQLSGAKKHKLAKVKADNELESDLRKTISFSDILYTNLHLQKAESVCNE